jgi:proteic killer suppression protein
MIRSFADAATRAIFVGEPLSLVRRLPPDVRARALRKLDVLDSARSLAAVDALPGTRLEALHGELAGFFSIRVNDQWRVVFRWSDGDATDVRLTDYHA